jgi:peptidoglycan/LPS O-acetylase OafA/YrhL
MKEIRALTGVRGIAALTVFLAHTRETLQSRGLTLDIPDPLVRLFLCGGRQVDIFFVLSGFILALLYREWFVDGVRARAYGEFLQRRFARIYPLHAVVLLLVIAFVAAAHALHAPTLHGLDRFTPSTLPAYFLLVQAWGFLGTDPGEWNPPSWSISIEALAYLLFPFLLWLSVRPARSHPWVLALGAVAVGLLLNWLTPWGLAGFPGIARGLSEFALGCATVNLIDSAASRWLQSSAGSLAALAALLVCFLLTPAPATNFGIGVCTAPLLLALLGRNAVSRFMGTPLVYFLGEISFSIYLGHFLYSTIAYRLISVPWMGSGALPLTIGLLGILAFVLTASTLTYFAVERPGRDLFRGRKAPPPPERIGATS